MNTSQIKLINSRPSVFSPQELDSMYKKNWITATFYLAEILKNWDNGKGWVEIDIPEFCRAYNIPRSSYYRAVKNLKEEGVIKIKPNPKNKNMIALV